MERGHDREGRIVTSNLGDGVAYVAVHGALDTGFAPKFTEQLLGIVDSGAGLVDVDLSACSFVDASGLNALVVAYRHAQHNGRRVAIVRASSQVSSLLEVTRLTELLGSKPLASP